MFILVRKKKLLQCLAVMVIGVGAVAMGRSGLAVGGLAAGRLAVGSNSGDIQPVNMQSGGIEASEIEVSGYLAIVIDDFGYCGEGTEDMLALPVPVTAAVMPFSECSAQDAKLAAESGKEAIIHMPMESLTGKKSWVGDKGIFRDMTDDEIRNCVQEAFEVAPNAVGLNNHMGSAIMEDKRALSAVMDVVAEKGLFFLDSMTTPNSVAEEVCREKNVTMLKRNVFLDSTDDVNVVKKQLRLAGEIAKKQGTAIAIGHVGPEGGNITVKAIRELTPELKQQGIEIIPITELVKRKQEKGA